MAITFSTYFCQSVQNNPRTTIIYSVAITALIGTLAALNWGDGVNVIVGNAVVGAHVVVLAITYVHFRRQSPPPPAIPAHAPPSDSPAVVPITFSNLFKEALNEVFGREIFLSHQFADQDVLTVLKNHQRYWSKQILSCRYHSRYNAYLVPILHQQSSNPGQHFLLFIEFLALRITVDTVIMTSEGPFSITNNRMDMSLDEDTKNFVKGILAKTNPWYHLALNPPAPNAIPPAGS